MLSGCDALSLKQPKLYQNEFDYISRYEESFQVQFFFPFLRCINAEHFFAGAIDTSMAYEKNCQALSCFFTAAFGRRLFITFDIITKSSSRKLQAFGVSFRKRNAAISSAPVSTTPGS
ncbi:hypothetical protein Y032_0326g2574 [Ancylostoma ceylanicum]|uniref:Uncharacterized protein n=1 Tax=Ancylostoma ceylanicum TaxID=53326 RepID=A0A016S017_9BILA|nr:hypothetical protein Y032_0326g2574 [Ancylostoma ceylanicum]